MPGPTSKVSDATGMDPGLISFLKVLQVHLMGSQDWNSQDWMSYNISDILSLDVIWILWMRQLMYREVQWLPIVKSFHHF